MAARAKPAPAADLAQRQKPVQARAIRSRAHILEVAGSLLEEVGFDGFNTNLLADRADVRVRTVYRYFPNKLAVVAAVGEILFEKWARWNTAHFEIIATPGSDWEAQLPKMLNEWGARLSREPGGWAVLQTLNAIPQLRELDRAAFEGLAVQWREAIQRRAPRHEGDLTSLSYAIITVTYAYFDSFGRLPEDQRPLVASELAGMIAMRLRPVLDGAEQ